MTKQTIEVEGVPEGYKVIESHVTSSIKGTNSDGISQLFASITVKKIQQRRIVLELTQNELTLIRKISIEQRLLQIPGMLGLIKKNPTFVSKGNRHYLN